MNMNITNNKMKTLAVCLMSFAAASAFADGNSDNNKVYVEPFSIVPGENAIVNVAMQNDSVMSSLQFDIALPEGLELLLGDEERNSERITRTSHSLNISDYNVTGYSATRVTILAKGSKPEKKAIQGKEDVLFTFNVKADEKFNGGTIQLSHVIGSDATKVIDGKNIPAIERRMNNSEASVTADAGTVSYGPEALNITFTKNDTLSFYVDNKIENAVAVEANLNLPEGVEIDDVLMGDRISDNTSVNYNMVSANVAKIMVESIQNDPFDADKTLPVFQVVLKGTKETEGVVSFSDVLLSNIGTAFSAPSTTESVKVKVVDLNKKLTAELTDSLAAVEKAFNDTLAVISAYTTDEGKAWADSEDADAISNALTDARLNLEAASDAGTVDEKYAETLIAQLEEVKTAITTLAQKAAEAEENAKTIMGDVNGDGKVTMADANMIANHYLGNEQEGFNEKAADMNADGNITVADSNEVTNIYLSK